MGCISFLVYVLFSIVIYFDFIVFFMFVYGSNFRIELKFGVWGFYGVDVDGFGNINVLDCSMIWNDRNKIGYFNFDCNLDGVINVFD